MKNHITVLGIFFLTFIGCDTDLVTKVNHDNAKLQFMGRIAQSDSTSELYWSGTSVEIVFEGTELSATLKDGGKNYYNVIIDNDSIYTLDLEKGKKKYKLVESLGEGKHSVKLFRRTEWTYGKTSFYGFSFDEATEVLAIAKKQKNIEFYGNSITSGWAVEDYSGKDNAKGTNTNNWYSYAAVTARHFDADYTCISRGGIGVTVSWYPMRMSEMYDRLNPDDANSKWDFTKSTPDVVVVNLLQNDAFLVVKPNNNQFKERFGETAPTDEFLSNAYADFISTIRGKYPNAEIVCLLGNMTITQEGSKWPTIVAKAVNSLKDEKISTVFVPYKNTPGHPRIEEQQIIADSLISNINKNINWN
ncbi:MAG: GDSL-type esterase/lipase family protein [Bacteroidota bacterium]